MSESFGWLPIEGESNIDRQAFDRQAAHAVLGSGGPDFAGEQYYLMGAHRNIMLAAHSGGDAGFSEPDLTLQLDVIIAAPQTLITLRLARPQEGQEWFIDGHDEMYTALDETVIKLAGFSIAAFSADPHGALLGLRDGQSLVSFSEGEETQRLYRDPNDPSVWPIETSLTRGRTYIGGEWRHDLEYGLSRWIDVNDTIVRHRQDVSTDTDDPLGRPMQRESVEYCPDPPTFQGEDDQAEPFPNTADEGAKYELHDILYGDRPYGGMNREEFLGALADAGNRFVGPLTGDDVNTLVSEPLKNEYHLHL